MEFETVAKIVIPITTFVLGSAITLGLKKYELRRTTFRENVKLVADLTSEWYNQIFDLSIEMKKVKGKKADNLMLAYLHSRLILPRMLLSLEILSRYKKSKEICLLVKEFLKIVTDYEECELPRDQSKNREYDEDTWEDMAWVSCVDFAMDDNTVTQRLFSRLDTLLQQVQKEAARLLA